VQLKCRIVKATYANDECHIIIQVKERPDVGVYIKDLSGYVVNNADDMDRIMTLGHKNREYIIILLNKLNILL